jgi:hypothetical protein
MSNSSSLSLWFVAIRSCTFILVMSTSFLAGLRANDDGDIGLNKCSGDESEVKLI